MKRVFSCTPTCALHMLGTPLGFLFLFVSLVSGYRAGVCDAQASNRYTILFGWKTEGSHELLARQAAAFGRFKDARSLAISFGDLLGPTLIVRHDTADQFLGAAREAGFDYIIPSAREFMFGEEAARRFAENDRYPRFISANVVDRQTRRPIFDPYATWYVSGLRICIIALSDTAGIAGAREVSLAGIDAISSDDALTAVSVAVTREHADIVIAAGRIDRSTIMEMTRKHPFVDIFLTNRQSGGFSDSGSVTSTATVSGKPVYIGPEAGNQLGLFAVRYLNGEEEREFTTLTLGDAFPPEKNLLAALTRTLDEFRKRETEETAIASTGGALASALRRIFGTDAVFLHRQSLFYYPLKDSLTIFNVRNIIKPYEKLARYEVKGSILKSVLEDMKSRKDPGDRLIIAGLTADGKIDTIPAVNDCVYTILTTMHLRSGGNGYVQFRKGTNETLTDINMLAAVESFLVEKDERLRKLERKKPWTLTLSMKMGANLNRVDVDRDKTLYKNIPDPFKSMTDQFMGYFSFASNQNTFAIQRKRHAFSSILDMSYIRTGSRNASGKVIYGKSNDVLKLANKYTYNVPTFTGVPYVDMIFTSYLHPAPGRHPIRAEMSSGLTRKISKYWLEASFGMSGARDYFTNKNNFSTVTVLKVNKNFPVKSVLTSQSQLYSETRVYWFPSALYHSLFRHENDNRLSLQIWRKFDITFQVKTYSYRDSTKKKLATGFQYWVIFNYGMQWKL